MKQQFQAAIILLLSVVGVGQAGEKDIIERLKKAGVSVHSSQWFSEKDQLVVSFAENQDLNSSLVDLCELRHLGALFLRKIRITNVESCMLGKLKSLTFLSITDGGIGDKELADLTDLSGLTALDFENCPNVTDASIDNIAQLKGLVFVNLGGTGVTKEGVARLRKALPRCNIDLGK